MSDEPLYKIITDELLDEEDPVVVLLKQLEELKKKPIDWDNDTTLKEARERRQKEINDIEHQISDLIYLKRQRKMFKK